MFIDTDKHTHTYSTYISLKHTAGPGTLKPISELLLEQDLGSLTTENTFIFLGVIVIVLAIIKFEFIN